MSDLYDVTNQCAKAPHALRAYDESACYSLGNTAPEIAAKRIQLTGR